MSGCRWIERGDHVEAIRRGEPEERIYCCAPVIDGAWCARHKAIIYRPATPLNLARWRAAAGLAEPKRRRFAR